MSRSSMSRPGVHLSVSEARWQHGRAGAAFRMMQLLTSLSRIPMASPLQPSQCRVSPTRPTANHRPNGRIALMRFHLIDRVDAYEPGQWVRGRKLTSHAEEYWEESEDGRVMPAPLILEALCQAGTWLII